MWAKRTRSAQNHPALGKFLGTVAVIVLALSHLQPLRSQESKQDMATVRLEDLLQEAELDNPTIRASRQEWQAAQKVPTQASTLPDPQVVLQHFSVGSPRPFAGYTNSDFAYIGLGISQDLPYPGKLRLRGKIAEQEAAVFQQRYESVRRSVLASIKSLYFQLGYLSRTLASFESHGQLLQEVEQAAEARYRSGMGNQQDVMQARLERTKLLREIAMHHLEVAKLQAQIKQLVNRPQSSPDIEANVPTESPLDYSFEQLLAAAQAQSPQIAAAEKMIDKQSAQVELAQKDFYPDFNVQYLWQRTDPAKFRAYYMLSVGVRVPIHRSRKQDPELAQARLDLERSRSEHDVQSQQVAVELRIAYDTAQQTAELLRIYREGLQAQAQGSFEAALAAYQNNRQDFQPLMSSFLELLTLGEQYWQNLAEHETALARLEELTDLPLHAAEVQK
jgi:outer membrane protein, heavy metal efflux system